jgi:hypothetical protein
LSTIFEFAALMFVVWFVFRFIARVVGIRRRPAEPDDYAGVPAWLRPRPKSGAGTVALMEPDDDWEFELRGSPSRLRR